ncbi:hypothetical protein LTR66_001683 [Elasticomyces elasticus]|nr:hypothetical protein LTR66_001683 [Elasticomyces elasticus]
MSETVVGNNATQIDQVFSNSPWPELPMPRDAHLLSPMSQQILRIARMGQYRGSKSGAEENGEPGEDFEQRREVESGYSVKKWTQVAKNAEEPEPEYLAKRRKGLLSLNSDGAALPSTLLTAPTRKTKVRRLDPDGNTSIFEVLVPEGQPVDGEVAEEAAFTEVPEPVLPGTVVKGVGVANAEGVVVANDLLLITPQRRRPPPPKRRGKKGGPGRGRKRVAFTGPDGAPVNAITPQRAAVQNTVTGGSTLQPESSNAGGVSLSKDDTGISNGQNDEDEEDDEGEEEGEEGEDDDDDREEGEISDDETTLAPPAPAPPNSSTFVSAVQPSQPPPPPRDMSSSPDLPLATTSMHSRHTSFTTPTIKITDASQSKRAMDAHFPDGEDDLLGSLERSLEDEQGH